MNLDDFSKAVELQMKYEAHLFEMRKKAIENAQAELKLLSDSATYQTKLWSIDKMKLMFREYQRGMFNTRRNMAVLQSAFVKLSYVDRLEKLPSMWAGYNYVSRYLSSTWKTTKLSNGISRIQFVNQCMESTPERNSEEHLLLVECLTSCTEVLQNLYTGLEKAYEQLMKGRTDIWQAADWTLK